MTDGDLIRMTQTHCTPYYAGFDGRKRTFFHSYSISMNQMNSQRSHVLYFIPFVSIEQSNKTLR